MRVLITGARGQLGQSLRERVPEDWETIFTDSKTLDITNKISVDSMINGFQPDIIINTAAYTNVDLAERQSDKAFAINATGVQYLSSAAQNANSKLIHISTDYVFDGTKGAPYTPLDYVNPQSVYGQSKLAGEMAALAQSNQNFVVRTSNLYSEYGSNFVTRIIENFRKNQSITITNDQISSPTYSGNLAEAIISLCIQLLKGDITIASRILHFSDGISMSRSEFATHILNDILLIPDGKKYVHCSQSTPESIAKRPNSSILEVSPFFTSNTKNLTVLKQILSDLSKAY